MNAPGRSSRDYFPVLDGLRAISILLVVFSHCGHGVEKIIPGSLGVTIFFVISGFLITRQMIAEVEASGDIKIGRFYWRRILRLLPVLMLYLLIFVPVLMHLGARISVAAILSGVIGYANYYHIFTGYPLYSPMPILWSLSVEEHYYILFPFMILAFRRKLPEAIPLFTFLIIAMFVWRMTLYTICSSYDWPVCGLPGKIRTQGTDAIVDCIFYGVLLAMMLRYYSSKIIVIVNDRAFVLAMALLLLSLIIRNPGFRATLRYSLQAGCSAVIIANLLLGKNRLSRKLLIHPAMIFIGRQSYSLYLMHFGALITIDAAQGSRRLESFYDIVLYLFFSFFLASCSYFLVENPMITLRHRKKAIA